MSRTLEQPNYTTSLGTQRSPGYKKLLRRKPALKRYYRETKFSLLKLTNST